MPRPIRFLLGDTPVEVAGEDPQLTTLEWLRTRMRRTGTKEGCAVEFSAYSILPSGADSTIVARLGDTELTIRVMGISKINMDEKIWLKFDPKTLNLYNKESGKLVTA